ncbi:maestro heat-like repeat-containing protein family member 6 [Harpia harpyja]|uniref:maestro heat-like repeat-containing protein family member 6 n=1 Tax=Harpia harpyja TaxID=202280 RepID=UPI0022B15F66|nr:maestro heat-like repeat-containing protein family member 6 [Harpia harpyja]
MAERPQCPSLEQGLVASLGAGQRARVFPAACPPALPALSWPDLCCSTLAVPREEDNTLDIVRAFLRSRPKQEAQKLRFLASICTVCSTTSVDSTVWDMLYFCQLEVVETIEVLLQEEPAGHQGIMVQQQAMLAITSMSRVGLLLQEKKSSLLYVCFCSIFHLPPQEDTQGPDASLYSKTLATMDSMLQVLVRSAGTLGIVELQNILELLLPFTNSQLAAVQERAMARIARLANFITTYSLPQVCPCFAQATVLRHQCSKTHQFVMLGKLVGHLTLCCTCKDKGTRHEAAEALHHLHTFVLQQRSRWPWLHDTGQLQLQEGWQATQPWQLLHTSHIGKIFLMFTKYLQPSDRADVILMAIKSLRAPSAYSISLAAHMVDVLVADHAFQPGQVLNIVWAIYRSLPSVRAVVALKSLDRALLVLTGKHPSEVVASLLQCSPMCTHVAVAMWRAMMSEPQAAEKVLRELLSMLMNQSLRKTSTSTKDNPRILSLAAARTISEILLQSVCLWQVEAIFPQLFLALLFQVSFTTELTLQEVHIFWKEHQQDLLTPIRSAVQSMRVLLCSMGFESQVLAIEVQGGWDTLLSSQTHLMGVRIIAREMMKTPSPLCSTIFCHLAELLSAEDPTWEMVAMVFFIEMLNCTNLSEELDRALEIFPVYLQSQCLGMPSLVLRAILRLTERPDTERKALILLPYVMEQLQGADSDASAAALPVLGNMLQLLEGKTLSLTALALADKLQPLFDDELDTVRELSIRLFQIAMGLVVGAEKKKMKKKVWDSLLPLLFHLHDQDKSVAKASQEALRSAGQFLKWGQLAQLAETAQAWRICECLLARKRSRAKDYLCQSQTYLQSPQEPLRQEAVRFIGLIGRDVDEHKKVQYIREILQGTSKDTSPLVSSLATQMVLILGRGRLKSRFNLPRLSLQMPRAWMRSHSVPSEDSAQTETKQEPQP